MAEKYDWRLKDPRYRKVFSNFLRNRPYGDDWRYSPVQLHGVKRGTAAAAAAAAAGRGCQQQDAAKRTSLPSTSRTAEDEIRQRQGGGDGNDNNNNNTYTTDKPKKPMKRRNTIAADHVVVTESPVPSSTPSDEEDQPSQQQKQRRRLTAEAARQLLQKRSARATSIDPNFRGPVTRSKSPHFGLWSPLANDADKNKKTTTKKNRTKKTSSSQEPVLVNIDVQAVEKDAHEDGGGVSMVRLSEYKKIVENKTKMKRRDGSQEQFSRLFGELEEGDKQALVEENSKQESKVRIQVRIDSNKATEVKKDKGKSVAEKSHKKVAAAMEKEKPRHTDGGVERKKKEEQRQKVHDGKEKQKHRESTERKHKHKHRSEHKTSRKTSTDDDTTKQKQQPLVALSLGRIDNDDADMVVPPKKRKQLVSDDQIDKVFPTPNATAADTPTITLSGNSETVLLRPQRVLEATVEALPEPLVEECGDLELAATPEAMQANEIEAPGLSSITTVTEKPEVRQEIIDLTTLTSTIKSERDAEPPSKNYSFCNKSLAANISDIIYTSMLDHYVHQVIDDAFTTQHLTPKEIEEELALYKQLFKRKLWTMRTNLVKFLADVGIVLDFDVWVFLSETVDLLKGKMQHVKVTCDLPLVYDVLDAACTLIEDRNRSPFIEQFVDAVEAVKERVAAVRAADTQPLSNGTSSLHIALEPTPVPCRIPSPQYPIRVLQTELFPALEEAQSNATNNGHNSPLVRIQQLSQQPSPTQQLPPQAAYSFSQSHSPSGLSTTDGPHRIRQLQATGSLQSPQNYSNLPFTIALGQFNNRMYPPPPPVPSSTSSEMYSGHMYSPLQEMNRQQQQQLMAIQRQSRPQPKTIYSAANSHQHPSAASLNYGGGGGRNSSDNSLAAMETQLGSRTTANATRAPPPPPSYERSVMQDQRRDYTNQFNSATPLNQQTNFSSHKQQQFRPPIPPIQHPEQGVQATIKPSRGRPPRKQQQQRKIAQAPPLLSTENQTDPLLRTALKPMNAMDLPTHTRKISMYDKATGKYRYISTCYTPHFVHPPSITLPRAPSTTTALEPTQPKANAAVTATPSVVPSVVSVVAPLPPPTALSSSGGGVVVEQVEPGECEVLIMEEIEDENDLIIDLTSVQDDNSSSCEKNMPSVKLEQTTSQQISPNDERTVTTTTEKETKEILHPDVHNKLCLCGKRAVNVCRCKMVMYCSTTCQTGDWINHRDNCDV